MAQISEKYDDWLAKQPKFESKVKKRKTGITKKEAKKHRQTISHEGTEEKKKK